MQFRIWLGTAVLSTMFIAVACQSGESPLAGGERQIAAASFDLATDEGISQALNFCNDDGTGQGNAGATRFGNAVRKYDSGSVSGGQSDALQLLDWEYERADMGKWQVQRDGCGETDFEAIMTAVVNRVGLNLSIAWDGGLCSGDQAGGCAVVSNNSCTGILTPNPGTKIYYVTFDEIAADPFVAKAPIFNSYPRWSDVKVFDVDGNLNPLADLTGNPATVAIFVEGQVPVAEEGLRLGHLKNAGAANEFVEILPPDQFPVPLTCSSTASSGLFDRFASLFQVGSLYSAGTKSGLLSSFSPVGPIDPKSDTKVGITPTSPTLTDNQSVTLTATVSGVNGVDTHNTVYPAAPMTAGDPLDFIVDGEIWGGSFATNENGRASLTLTCGSTLDFGEHVIGVEYHATDTHAESSTSDGDSPTGVATVNCNTPFNVINFDRDPNNRPLKNGEIVNGVYGPAVGFCRSTGNGQCGSGNVFAVSDPNTGNFGSPPRVVSLFQDRSPIQGTVDGWVLASFQNPQSQVCIAVFPTAKGGNAPKGELRAYYSDGTWSSKQDQGKEVCVDRKKQGQTWLLIQRVEFSGVNGAAKFDNLRYR